MQITDKVQQRRLQRRLHSRATLTSKQLWRLVKRTVKKKGILTAAKDVQGKLATDRKRIEEIVLEELAKVFSGQHSTIFSQRGEQLIKEMDIKHYQGQSSHREDEASESPRS